LTAFCVLVCQTGPVTETYIAGTSVKVFDSTLRGKNILSVLTSYVVQSILHGPHQNKIYLTRNILIHSYFPSAP